MVSGKILRAALKTVLGIAELAGRAPVPGAELLDGGARLRVSPSKTAPAVGLEPKALKRYLDALAEIAVAEKAYDESGKAVYTVDLARAREIAINIGVASAGPRAGPGAGEPQVSARNLVDELARRLAEAVRAELEPLVRELRELRRTVEASKPGTGAEDLRRELERYRREAERYRRLYERYRREAEDYKKRLEELRRELERARQEAGGEARKRIAVLEAELRRLRRENEELRSRLESLERENAMLRRMLRREPIQAPEAGEEEVYEAYEYTSY